MSTTKSSPEMKPVVRLIGEDGNAFAILGRCRRAARDAGWSEEQWDAGWSEEQWTKVREEMTFGDYNTLLATAMKYFDVR